MKLSQNKERIRGIASFLLALILILPISMFEISGLQIPLSDIAVCFGGFFFLTKIGRLETLIFCLAVLMSFLAVFVIAIEHYGFLQIRPVLSVFFFYKPILGYFLAISVIKDKQTFEQILKWAQLLIFLFVVVVIFSVHAEYDGLFRDRMSVLQGDFFNLPLYAAFGVNSLASFYFLMAAVSILAAAMQFRSWQGALGLVNLVLLSYLIFNSASREALLAMMVFIFCVMGLFLRRTPKVLVGVVFIFGTALVLFFTSDYVGRVWAHKIDQIVTALERMDLDMLSSGRIGLYKIALQQWSKNILVGTGFHGFQLFIQDIPGIGYPAGLSPHNLYITALWKMGLVGFVPYVCFLYLILKKSFSVDVPAGYKYVFISLCIAVLLVLNGVWEIFMVANFGTLFFFLLGAFVKLNENKLW
ncbi:hypothetical protein AZI86_11115 [Bdellovibrio bacteriovorus]|uniref:O-antigen ligase-related domain-containing protein n=1 Tax=Bdellovibrio bacteriovorus TaxID=959 RepID=A0A150WL64_BDEBC|nr:O-antigen ligase family protein [Bdellovibrio bacteriovorus]KYG64749.1 hypothetical protein AZI86_11115 [Bdellovibrio bacteriovorus]